MGKYINTLIVHCIGKRETSKTAFKAITKLEREREREREKGYGTNEDHEEE